MHEIGVRELKTRASEIVRNVRRRRTRYVITYRGWSVAPRFPSDRRAAPVERAGQLLARFRLLDLVPQ